MIRSFYGHSSLSALATNAKVAFLALCLAGFWSPLGFLFVVASGQESSSDEGPDKIWFRAFLTFESAMENEKKGDLVAALNLCNDAKMLYDGLAYKHPSFQPDIVKYKRQVVADARLRIRDTSRRKALGNSLPAPPAPAAQQVVERTGELPMVETPQTTGPTIGSTQIEAQPEPQFYQGAGGGSEALPSWRPNQIVGDVSSQILKDAQARESLQQSLIRDLKKSNLEWEARSKEWEAKYRQAAAMAQKYQQESLHYRQQMVNDPSKVGQMRMLLNQALDQIKQLTSDNARLVEQLQAARERIRIQKEQIDQLQTERDNLASIIEGRGLGSETLRNLMEQNRKLAQRLDLAEKVAVRTAGDSQRKDQAIEELKSEIEKVGAERERLVDENVRHQVEIEGLQKKLELLSDGLSDGDRHLLSNMAPEQRSENELLRSMILKQLRRQAQQQQAKELLLRQLDRVGDRSSRLLETVEDIARGVQISPEERALFRSPQIVELIDSVSPFFSEIGEDPEDPAKVYGSLSAPASPAGQTVVKNQTIEVELSQLEKAARLDYLEGRYADAEAGFLKYLQYRPRSVPCLCNLGVLKISLKSYSEAGQYLQKAVAIDRDSPLANYLLGRTYFLQQNQDEALHYLEKSIKLQPKNAKAHNCVGVIASQKGWMTRAERAFFDALGIDPHFADAHFNLAVLFMTRPRPDAAKSQEHYFKALDLDRSIARSPAIESFLKNHARPVDLGLVN